MRDEWLPWLGRVRFLVITVLVAVVIAVASNHVDSVPVRSFVPLIGFGIPSLSST